MLKFSRPAALLLACACILPLAACAKDRNKSGDTAYVARDVSSLYTAAQRTMQQGEYEQAAKLFDEVERQHPYSSWARHAQVMSAFNYYLAQKYNDAISSAQRFLTIHPGSDEAPYAQYIVGMSYYQQIPDAQSRPVRHLAGFRRVQRACPPLSGKPLRFGRTAQARPHQGPSRRQGDGGRTLLPALGPVARRDLSLPQRVDQYQTTSHAPEALERLVECYLSLGIPDEAWKASAVLGKQLCRGPIGIASHFGCFMSEQSKTGMWTASAPQPGGVTTNRPRVSPGCAKASGYPHGQKPQAQQKPNGQ